MIYCVKSEGRDGKMDRWKERKRAFDLGLN